MVIVYRTVRVYSQSCSQSVGILRWFRSSSSATENNPVTFVMLIYANDREGRQRPGQAAVFASKSCLRMQMRTFILNSVGTNSLVRIFK